MNKIFNSYDLVAGKTYAKQKHFLNELLLSKFLISKVLDIFEMFKEF